MIGEIVAITGLKTFQDGVEFGSGAKAVAELIRAVARVNGTAPQYAELAEEIATQPNVLKAVAKA